MPRWLDKTIWSPEEIELRKITQKLFQSNYSRDELHFMVDKSLFALCLCDWHLPDFESRQMLTITKPAFIKLRDSMCFDRELTGPITDKDEEAYSYFKNKLLPQRELLQKQVELAKLRENINRNTLLEGAALRERIDKVDESLCAEDRKKVTKSFRVNPEAYEEKEEV